jgi:hypothetical protein
MREDRVDWLVNHIHVACLSLLRLKKLAPYGGDPAFLALQQGFLQHGRRLMDFIREREAGEREQLGRGGF